MKEKFGRLQSAGYSSVRFGTSLERSGLHTDTTLASGILIYAVNTSHPESRGATYLGNGVLNANWVIPNGPYVFYAIGYVNSDLTGAMYCAKSGAYTLNGSEVSVSLSLSATGVCGTAPFVPSGYNLGGNPDAPSPFYLGNCVASGGDMTLVTAATYCDTSAGRPVGASGVYSSGIISLPAYDAFDGTIKVPDNTPSMSTGCFTAAPAGTAVSLSRTLPVGDGTQNIFALGLDLFGSGGCVSDSTVRKHEFGNGLYAAANNAVNFYKSYDGSLFAPGGLVMSQITGDTSYIKLYVRSF